jgi:hypothetical protein
MQHWKKPHKHQIFTKFQCLNFFCKDAKIHHKSIVILNMNLKVTVDKVTCVQSPQSSCFAVLDCRDEPSLQFLSLQSSISNFESLVHRLWVFNFSCIKTKLSSSAWWHQLGQMKLVWHPQSGHSASSGSGLLWNAWGQLLADNMHMKLTMTLTMMQLKGSQIHTTIIKSNFLWSILRESNTFCVDSNFGWMKKVVE